MDVQPFPLWLVWDETTDTASESYAARVLGWVVGAHVFPVVIHPDTGLPVTLGLDNAAAVSRMWATESPDSAALEAEGRLARYGRAR